VSKLILLVCFAALACRPASCAAEEASPTFDEPSRAAGSDWTGPYVGGGVGGRWMESRWETECLASLAFPDQCPNDFFTGSTRTGNDNPADLDDSAARLSAYLGADRQFNRWVVGVEGDLGWADNSETHIGIPGTWSADFGGEFDHAEVESEWDASVRARVGFLVAPTVLLYSTGGLAVLQQEVAASCDGAYPMGWCIAPRSESADAVYVGWTIGGGAEWQFTYHWAVRGEYRYSDYGERSFTFFEEEPLDSIRVNVSTKASMAYLGLSRRF
jgi:outer membrane immunogenic protein